MTKYKINLKYLNNLSENLFFFDNNNNKKVKDLKEYITCFDNSICSCMIIIPKNDYFFFFESEEYYSDDMELNKISKNFCINIRQNLNKCKCNFLMKNEKLLNLTKKSLISKINELNESSKIKNEKDFYDLILRINSLVNLNKGWNIEISKNSEYNFNLNKKIGVIGVLGNINSGKTFIISKLTNTNLNSGTHIETDGLSIKYLLKDNHKNLDYQYIFLDTKGLNQPILENINKSKDIILTNIFLQNFIILYCDILLLVIDYLSFSEQILINKIKRNLKLVYGQKILIIIHNLKKYTKIKQVKSYINNILLKSFSFKLKRNETVTSKRENVILGEYFTEYNEKDIKVFHLIFADDKSEAGLYYNGFSKNFIEIHYKDILNLRKFDIIENIKKHFCLQSKIYFNTKINKDDFLSNDDIIKEKAIRLKYPKELMFKDYLCEEIGIQILEDNYFIPKYSILKTGKNLEIQVELPGNVKADILRPKFIDNNTHIYIMGNKFRDKEPKEKNDNFVDIRNYGNFKIDIILDRQDYKINQKIKSWNIKDGILYIILEIEDENSNEITTLTVCEEI